MPPTPRQPRLPAVLRSAFAQVHAGVAPQDAAADLIRKHAERVIPAVRSIPSFRADGFLRRISAKVRPVPTATSSTDSPSRMPATSIQRRRRVSP